MVPSLSPPPFLSTCPRPIKVTIKNHYKLFGVTSVQLGLPLLLLLVDDDGDNEEQALIKPEDPRRSAMQKKGSSFCSAVCALFFFSL